MNFREAVLNAPKDANVEILWGVNKPRGGSFIFGIADLQEIVLNEVNTLAPYADSGRAAAERGERGADDIRDGRADIDTNNQRT